MYYLLFILQNSVTNCFFLPFHTFLKLNCIYGVKMYYLLFILQNSVTNCFFYHFIHFLNLTAFMVWDFFTSFTTWCKLIVDFESKL
jgi:hypothetical protein